MQATNSTQFVDLVIKEAEAPMFKRMRGEYGICSLSKKDNQQIINLRIPTSVQQKILAAYKQGKTVRIFA